MNRWVFFSFLVEVTGFEPANSLSIGDDRCKYGHLSLRFFEIPAIIGLQTGFTSSFLHRLFVVNYLGLFNNDGRGSSVKMIVEYRQDMPRKLLT